MIKKLIKGRVYVFIDGANIFYSQKSLGWRISYEKLINYFKKECGSKTKCFVYIATIPGNEKQKKFLDLLDILGYIVRTKPIKIIKDAKGREFWKGNLDLELGLEMVDTISSYQTAILVSGDSDFAPVVDRVKRKGRRVLVFSAKGHVSRELIQRAKYINFRKLKGRLVLKEKSSAKSGGDSSLNKE